MNYEENIVLERCREYSSEYRREIIQPSEKSSQAI